jgi:hypothetical protein
LLPGSFTLHHHQFKLYTTSLGEKKLVYKLINIILYMTQNREQKRSAPGSSDGAQGANQKTNTSPSREDDRGGDQWMNQ